MRTFTLRPFDSDGFKCITEFLSVLVEFGGGLLCGGVLAELREGAMLEIHMVHGINR